MSFTSVGFIVFCGVLLILYYVIPKKAQWMLLLAASYFFYLFAGTEYLGFILFTTITTYLVTNYMSRQYKRRDEYLALHKSEMSKDERKAFKHRYKVKSRVWFIIVIALNFGILFACKALLTEPVSALAEGTQVSFLSLGLPMGMSFYMLQSMGYVIDVYREKAEPLKNPFKTALFTSFFPMLVQGPISKFDQLKDQLFCGHSFDRKTVAFGLERMLWGFFKKMVIADRIAVALTPLSDTSVSDGMGVSFFILCMFYAVQLYADFSGGIDIAIGIAEALGITLPENFIRPFFSTNIADYWRRWHITMNEWMKNYIFYPITVSGPMLKLSVKARKRFGKFGMRITVYIGTLITWFCTGIWHGFNLHFVVWGMINAVVILISEELSPVYAKFHNKTHLKGRTGYTIFEIVRTFLMMSIIRATDLFVDVGTYFKNVGSLFYHFNFSILTDGTLGNLGLSNADYVILAAGVVIMFLVSFFEEKNKRSVREQLLGKPVAARYAGIILMLLCVVVLGQYGIGYDASNFIYGQF